MATCNYADDEECIAMCRGGFDNEVGLPDICRNECTRSRPLLFVDWDQNTSVGALESITNARLNTASISTPGIQTYVQHNQNHVDPYHCYLISVGREEK